MRLSDVDDNDGDNEIGEEETMPNKSKSVSFSDSGDIEQCLMLLTMKADYVFIIYSKVTVLFLYTEVAHTTL